MTCPREIEIDRLIGGSLEEAESQALEEHLAGCPVCAGEQERATAESVRFKRDLAPFRFRGDLADRTLARVERRPSILPQLARWGVAASLFMATMVVVLLAPEKSDPTPAVIGIQDPPQLPRAPIEITAMEIERVMPEGEALQRLLPEELPFLSRELETAALWSTLDELPESPTGNFNAIGWIEARIAFRRDDRMEDLRVRVRRTERGFVLTFNPHEAQDRTTEGQVAVRVWTILDRAMNPMQTYLEPGSGRKRSFLAVYRGGDYGKIPGADLEVAEERDGDRIANSVAFHPPAGSQDRFALRVEAELPVSRAPGSTPSRLFKARWVQGKQVSSEVIFDGGLAVPERTALPEWAKGWKHPWAGFGVGSRVTLRTTFGGANPAPEEVREYAVESVTAGDVTISDRFIGRQKTDGESSWTQSLGLADPGPSSGPPTREDLKVGNRVFSCLVYEFRREPPANPIVTRIWMSPDAPAWPLKRTEINADTGRGFVEELIEIGAAVDVGNQRLDCNVVRRKMIHPDLDAADFASRIETTWHNAAVPGGVAMKRSQACKAGKEIPGDAILTRLVSFERALNPRLLPLAEALEKGRKENKPILCYVHRNDWQGEEKIAKVIAPVIGDWAGRVILGHLNVQAEKQWIDVYALRKWDGAVLVMDGRNEGVGRVLARLEARDEEVTPAAILETLKAGAGRWDDYGACRKVVTEFVDAVLKDDLDRLNKTIWPGSVKSVAGVKRDYDLRGVSILDQKGTVADVGPTPEFKTLGGFEEKIEARYTVMFVWGVKQPEESFGFIVVRTAGGFFVLKAGER